MTPASIRNTYMEAGIMTFVVLCTSDSSYSVALYVNGNTGEYENLQIKTSLI